VDIQDIYFEPEINEANEEQINERIKTMDYMIGNANSKNPNNLKTITTNAQLTKALEEHEVLALKKIFTEEEEKESKDTIAGSTEKTQKRVLIVDDSPFNLMTLNSLMRQNYAIRCDEASNGEIAINMIREADKNGAPYKIIFLDCNMPVLDGFETTKKLKRLMYAKEIEYFPIIALTALVSNDDKKKCLAVGMDQYLSKPVLIRDLKDMLIRYKILNTDSELEEE